LADEDEPSIYDKSGGHSGPVVSVFIELSVPSLHQSVGESKRLH
jgi:hypothetical protein